MSTQPVIPTTIETRKKVTTRTFRLKKRRAEPITMLTAYDYATAMAIDKAGIDSILVGDSLGMVVLGYENTLPVTMEDMLHHCKAVARGAKSALLIGDMPFMSYQISIPDAVRNAGRFLQEAGMDAVKLEGGRERADAIRAITSAGIPVVGHLGLTPQSVHQLGGFRAQAKEAAAAKALLEDALILQEAGCFAIVLEAIPEALAAEATAKLTIPTIGIGASRECSGQVLVLHDMLDISAGRKARFVRNFMAGQPSIGAAIAAYVAAVKDGSFPAPENCY